MTALTQNLPWFVKDLGVAIIGETCYTSLVENLEVTNVVCLKYSLSKGLGLGIVLGGAIMKVPQILLIVNARSARGLSLTAYILETLSYAITLTYSIRNSFPFSTYGENLFLTLQNTLIVLLIVYYAPRLRSSALSRLIPHIVGIVATSSVLFTIPVKPLAFLQLSTLPLSLFSKLPQITQNHRAKSTGQLSAFAVISQIAGCLARLFTTATEVGDPIVTAGFALALVLNVVLGFQLWAYWGRDSFEKEKVGFGVGTGGAGLETTGKRREELTSPISVEVDGEKPLLTHRVATPPPSTPGRKWARKVD